MGTVRVERCPDCNAMIGEGTLYVHQQGTCKGYRKQPARVGYGDLRVRVSCDVCGAFPTDEYPIYVFGKRRLCQVHQA